MKQEVSDEGHVSHQLFLRTKDHILRTRISHYRADTINSFIQDSSQSSLYIRTDYGVIFISSTMFALFLLMVSCQGLYRIVQHKRITSCTFNKKLNLLQIGSQNLLCSTSVREERLDLLSSAIVELGKTSISEHYIFRLVLSSGEIVNLNMSTTSPREGMNYMDIAAAINRFLAK